MQQPVNEDKLAQRLSNIGKDVLCDSERTVEWREFGKSGDGAYYFDSISSEGTPVQVRLQFCTDRIIRITHTHKDTDDKTCSLAKEDWEPVTNTCETLNDRVALKSDCLAVVVQNKPFRISVYNHSGKRVWSHQTENRNGLGEYLSCVMGRGSRQGDTAAYVTESIELGPKERIYGFGERFDELEKRGKKITTFTQAPMVSNPSACYKPIPFYISSSGYGLLVNTTVPVTFDVGQRSCEAISIAHEGQIMDYFLIVSDNPKEIIRGYHLITGAPEVPPEWTFGYMQSSANSVRENGDFCCGYSSQEEVLDIARRLRQEKIPCESITLDAFWSGDYGPCAKKVYDWTFSYKFPDPRAMTSELNDMGIKLCVTQWPYLRHYFPDFESVKAKSLLVGNADGEPYIDKDENYGFLDLTNPEGYEWLKAKNRELRKLGVSSFMADFCEDYPLDGVYHSGISGIKAHNIMPILYQKALYEVAQEGEEGAGTLWARAGYIGAQKTPGHWAGDNRCSFQSMASVIRAGLSFGISGCPIWGHDIGGYFGVLVENGTVSDGPSMTGPSEELFVRWGQFGFFSPWFRSHGATPREPWAFGEDILDMFRRYAEFRSRLIPYVYDCALQSQESGAPIMRAMFLEFPNDPTCWTLEHQYMFGDALMVAPVCEEGETTTIYFPEGRWQDIWNKETFTGPSWRKYHAPLHKIPVFQKCNTILPLGPVRQHVSECQPEPLELWAFVDERADLTLRGDDRLLIVSAKRTAGELETTVKRGNWLFNTIDRIQADYHLSYEKY